MLAELKDLIKPDEESQTKFEHFKTKFYAKNKEQEKALLKKSRAIAFVLAGATVVSLLFLLFAFSVKTTAEAEKNRLKSKIYALEERLNRGSLNSFAEQTLSKISNSLPDPLEAGWNNQPVCEILQENAELRVLKCTFPPEIGHEKHFHRPYITYTVAGSRFRITDATGSREVDVLTGSSFLNDGIEWHHVLNIGDSTAIFLIIESKL